MRASTVSALLGLILMAYSGNPALGQDLTGADIATQPFFHFRTNYVELCGGVVCGEDIGTYWAYGNRARVNRCVKVSGGFLPLVV